MGFLRSAGAERLNQEKLCYCSDYNSAIQDYQPFRLNASNNRPCIRVAPLQHPSDGKHNTPIETAPSPPGEAFCQARNTG